MEKKLTYSNDTKNIQRNKTGNIVIGIIVGFTKTHIFIFIGYHKILAVIDIFETHCKLNWILFFRVESKKIQEIRQK
nr:hypothetical protein CcurKRNrm3_p047 [Cryptomonas curvata]